jgi:hypothetical protein
VDKIHNRETPLGLWLAKFMTKEDWKESNALQLISDKDRERIKAIREERNESEIISKE